MPVPSFVVAMERLHLHVFQAALHLPWTGGWTRFQAPGKQLSVPIKNSEMVDKVSSLIGLYPISMHCWNLEEEEGLRGLDRTGGGVS